MRMPRAPITTIDAPYVESLLGMLTDVATSYGEAVAMGDARRAAGLVLAARLARSDFRLSPEQLGWLLRRIEDPVLLPCLVGACDDARDALCDFLESEPPWESRCSALVTLYLILGDKAPSIGLPLVGGLLRRWLRNPAPTFTFPLGIACDLFQEPSEDAQPLRKLVTKLGYQALLEDFRLSLAGDFRDTLPTFGAAGMTARRQARKVGRNEFCPCGSGKKYKKCCEGKDSAVYEKFDGPARPLEEMRLDELVQLDPTHLNGRQLERLVGRLGYAGLLDEAAQAFEVLKERADTTVHADEVRIGLIRDSARRRDMEIIRRLLADFDDNSPHASTFKALGLLVKVDNQAAQGLSDLSLQVLLQPDSHHEVADILLRLFPPLGIIFARSAFDPTFEVDDNFSELLDHIEQVRAELGLVPEDAFQEVFDLVADFDFGEEEDELDGAGSHRERLSEATSIVQSMQLRVQEAEEKLKALETSAARVRSEPPSLPGPSPAERKGPVAATPIPETADEIQRLKERVNNLKETLRNRNEERSQLRKQLAQPRKEASTPIRSTVPAAEEQSEELLDEARYPPLLPLFSRGARGDLSELSQQQARQAFRLVGELGASDEVAWSKVKRLQQGEGVYSARLGLSFRMLFRVNTQDKQLLVERLIPRAELERALRQIISKS